MDLPKLKRFAPFDTAGRIAVASLLLCGISGALLAIPYDFSRAYQSIFEILMFNPAGVFVRNLHYWSAQLFFITMILHIYDHLSKSTETNISSRRTWFILCLMIAFLGYEMISGFVLKGDAAGLQARRIVASMLESVPLFGKMLGWTFTGSEENWQVVYVQHIATGTIFLFIGLYEHVKIIWPRMKTFLIVAISLLCISLVFRAPLGLPESNQLKGPWFFVGVQEMLHWTGHPGYVVLLFAIVFAVLFFLPQLPPSGRLAVKRILLATGILYLFVILLVLLFRGESWKWKGLSENRMAESALIVWDPVRLATEKTPPPLASNQKPESCLLCHSGMKGLSDAHNPATTGCFACHEGDPFSADKQKSHQKMIKIPGDFSNVMQTCGNQACHQEIAERMSNSLMTTQSGIVAVDKFVFRETGSLNDSFHVRDLGHSAADTHLRNLCAGCHLGKEKTKPGNAGWLERGGGCNACHLHYDEKALASMKAMQTTSPLSAGEIHPAIDIAVSNDRCKSCHSRSGRISLNYEGWNETALTKSQVTDTTRQKLLPDDRVLEFVQSDVHFQKGMACIDCHGSYEIMGDGKHHAHKEEAVRVQCVDCHPTGKPNSMVLSNLPDRESQMIAGLRRYDPASRIVVTAARQQPLLNTRLDSLGQIFLTDKLNGKTQLSKRQSPVCSKGKGHSRLSCQSCHIAWVPQCIGCHNAFEKGTSGYDMLTGLPTKGTWVEYAGKSFVEPPVLGVDNQVNKVVTAMPGMIMDIDKESFTAGSGKNFHRLYAPASGHTTQRQGRSCKSCHNDPLAIGFGRGELKFTTFGASGKWSYEPKFALSPGDHLPEDAWTGFLKEAATPYATRVGLRPFMVVEQKKILEVGSCLTCHDGQSKVMEWALEDYPKCLVKRKSRCIAPSW